MYTRIVYFIFLLMFSVKNVVAQYQFREYQSTYTNPNSLEISSFLNGNGKIRRSDNNNSSSQISYELGQKYYRNKEIHNTSIGYWNHLLNYELKSYEKAEFDKYGKLIDEVSERGDYENLTVSITQTYDYLSYLYTKYKMISSEITCNEVIKFLLQNGKWIAGYTFTGSEFDLIHFYSFEGDVYAVVRYLYFQDNIKLARGMNYIYGPIPTTTLENYKYIAVGKSEDERFLQLIAANKCGCE